MSAWEDGLRRLHKTGPSQNIQSTVINIMQGPGDDRSAALAAAALADTGLMAGILLATRSGLRNRPARNLHGLMATPVQIFRFAPEADISL